jgi:hypothetical protein
VDEKVKKINYIKYMEVNLEWVGVGGIGILLGIAGYSMMTKSFSPRSDTPLRNMANPPYTSSDLEYETESDVNDKYRTMSVGGKKSKKRRRSLKK